MQTHFYTTAALTALLSAVSGHMIMQTPTPYSAQNLDNSPLTGSNYPCKLSGDPATFYSRDGITNTMAVGETQTLSFKGSAVHGGGSCQLAITKDLQPSASTSWQVILSIEGGCPSKTGSGPDTYDFAIPDSVAPGDYSFAWTWQSKLAGQPEYYMNCAPITVTGGSSSKRSANETMELLSRADELPELFVGNMATINDCKTAMSSDAEYPNPGPNVIRPGSNNQFAPVTGTNCVPKGATDNSGSGSGSGSDSGSGSASSAASSSTAAATSSSPTTLVTSTTSAAATSPATSTTSAAPATSASSAPASGSSGSPSSGGAGGLTGACTEEGTFNCVGGASYQQCASGAWTAMMPMPATTKCQEGKSTTLWGRSAVADEEAKSKGSKKSFIGLRRRGGVAAAA
ncbi:hypothetical protein F4809DRAFT_651059 [Biscogniauxia mediterranea]|nr:hypothetical protein F4809DRAFT_651059 [Biscogniauxia mediterranea]